MKYKELKIHIAADALYALEEVLTAAGFTAMQIDDPAAAQDIIDHPDAYKYDYLSEEILSSTSVRPAVTLYFGCDEEGAAECERAVSTAEAFGRQTSGSELECSVSETGDDSEWLYKWQEHFKPVKIGSRIVVKPGWEDYEPADGELVIEMDPGMAFGSGLHETTSMCIKALEKCLSQNGCERGDTGFEEAVLDGVAQNGIDRAAASEAANQAKDDKAESAAGVEVEEECSPPNKKAAKDRCRAAEGCDGPCGARVLDVGTGTGILAIAAALLGAADCLGIDIDDEAVRVAGENIIRNGVGDTVAIARGDLMQGIDFDADIIVANLMADLVMKLAPAAAVQLKPGGIFISSGILDIKEELVASAVKEAGFDITEIMKDGEWRAITAVRR